MRSEAESLKDRLDVYRALQRRAGTVPELERLVDLLESELRGCSEEQVPAPRDRRPS